jgi:hypothetical protein
MKSIYILALFLLCFSLGLKSQNFQNYELNSPYSDYFSDFTKVNQGYVITANQWGIEVDSANYDESRRLLIAIDNDGSNANIHYLDTFGIDRMNILSVSYNDNLYTIGVDDISSDTAMTFYMTVYDSNYNVLSDKSFPTIKREKLFFSQHSFIQDSILTLLGDYRKAANLDFWSFFLQINLNSLTVVKLVYFNERFLTHDIVDFYSDKSGFTFVVSGFGDNNLGASNVVVRYDSSFQLIDTINLGPYLVGNSNVLPYKDSLYIISGRGVDFWDHNPSQLFNYELRLQIVDSNFRFVDAKSYTYCDSTDARAGYVKNMVRNSNGDIFVGAYMEDNFLRLHPDAGIFIVKLDSELNTIWEKHIPGNAHYKLARIMDTDDGGLLLIIAKNPASGYNADAALVKIGSNGEITSITEIKQPNRRAIVKLYPNPCSQELNLSLLATDQQIQEIRLYDLQFKEIFHQSIHANQTKIDVSQLAKGVYLLEGLSSSGEFFREKFIVE